MKKEDAVYEAVNRVGEDGSIMGFTQMDDFEFLIDVILEKSAIDGDQYGVSDNKVRREVRTLLQTIAHNDSEDVIEAFNKGVGDIREKFAVANQKEYTIVFPLNFLIPDIGFPDTFTIRNVEIRRIGRELWENEYLSKAQEDRLFSNWTTKSENDTNSSIYSYWAAEYEAVDLSYAFRHVDEIVRILLGQLNFALYYKRQSQKLKRTPWSSVRSDLRTPFVYLGFSGGEYKNCSFSTDTSPRQKVKISTRKEERIESGLDNFYDFSPELTEGEEILLSGFLRYQNAISQYNENDCFLGFWQGIEYLTQNNSENSSGKVMERAKAPYLHTEKKLFEEKTNWITNKRNKIVHTEMGTKVTDSDINLIKDIFEDLMIFHMSFEGDWNKQDFRFIFNSGPTDKENEKKRRDQRKREIEVIDKRLSFFDDITIDENSQ